MTQRVQQIAVGAGFALVIAFWGFGALSTVAAVSASTRNTAGGPGSFMGQPPGGRFGGPGGRFGGPGGPLGMMRMAARLGLTDAQKEQIKALAQSHREEWRALAQRAVSARQGLHAAIAADTIDEAAIRQRSGEVAAVEADVAVATAHARAEMFKLLTPEQQEKAKAQRH